MQRIAQAASAGRSAPATAVALAVAASVVALQALLVPLFAGPVVNLAPRDLPVVVAGPPDDAERFASQLTAAAPGAFRVAYAADAAAADRALRDRDAYGAFVLADDGLALHTASAAGPLVAQLLAQTASRTGGEEPVPVVDVVPASGDDPRGAGFAAGFLPLVLTGVAAGAALAFAAERRGARVAGLTAYAVLSGLAAAAVLQGWLGVLDGAYLANAAALALIGLAVAAAVTGLGSVAGRPAIGLAVLLVFLVGNPLSAVAAAPELMPQPWGELGQWLPPGAGGSLLRSVAWFDGAGAARPAGVLTAWAAAGLALVLAGRRRHGAAPGRKAH